MNQDPAFIKVGTSFRAMHHWPGAQGHRLYLANPHRHDFRVSLTFGVTHDDRDIEFHDAQEKLEADLRDMAGHQHDFGSMSCEAIARELLERFPGATTASCDEDDFVGAYIIRRAAAVGTVDKITRSQDVYEPLSDPSLSMSGRPRIQGEKGIVTISGSTRFKQETLDAERHWMRLGWMVLRVESFTQAERLEYGPNIKERLDELHLRKIDVSDRVYVVNPGGYIGESTAREIEYAHKKKIKIQFMMPMTVEEATL